MGVDFLPVPSVHLVIVHGSCPSFFVGPSMAPRPLGTMVHFSFFVVLFWLRPQSRNTGPFSFFCRFPFFCRFMGVRFFLAQNAERIFRNTLNIL